MSVEDVPWIPTAHIPDDRGRVVQKQVLRKGRREEEREGGRREGREGGRA
jgi:hypothetical protein